MGFLHDKLRKDFSKFMFHAAKFSEPFQPVNNERSKDKKK